jgi:hypothetical protein
MSNRVKNLDKITKEVRVRLCRWHPSCGISHDFRLLVLLLS